MIVQMISVCVSMCMYWVCFCVPVCVHTRVCRLEQSASAGIVR